MTIPTTSSCCRSSSVDRRRSATSALILLFAGCGGAAPPAPPPPPPPPSPLELAAGSFEWSHETEESGVRRLENEHWLLARAGEQLRGEYRREVVFESTDGLPFSCNQAPSYRLRSAYELEGFLDPDGGALVLVETGYRTAPSPCEPAQRSLWRYQARPVEGGLELAWDGGRHMLRRAETATPRTGAWLPDRAEAAGTWRWTSHEPTSPGEARRAEREEWSLTEGEGGLVTGAYERIVTVTAPEGETLSCNGAPSYEYRDRYRVRGTRAGDRVSLAEIEVETEPHPCLVHHDRHLDAAIGRLYPEELVLTWRGDRRQVLIR
jgi:hypothetical protein